MITKSHFRNYALAFVRVMQTLTEKNQNDSGSGFSSIFLLKFRKKHRHLPESTLARWTFLLQ